MRGPPVSFPVYFLPQRRSNNISDWWNPKLSFSLASVLKCHAEVHRHKLKCKICPAWLWKPVQLSTTFIFFCFLNVDALNVLFGTCYEKILSSSTSLFNISSCHLNFLYFSSSLGDCDRVCFGETGRAESGTQSGHARGLDSIPCTLTA